MYAVNQILSAKYVQTKPYGSSGGSLRVHLNELMSEIPVGTPKITPVSLNKSCYANGKDCAPTIASKINTQNYATAQSPSTPYALPLYNFGSSIKVRSRTEDCLTCKLDSDEEDNSFII